MATSKQTPAATTTSAYWKFLRLRDGQIASEHGNTCWQIGEWQEVTGQPSTCERGFHCSRLALDALSYVHGEVVAQVEVAGAHAQDADKSAWQRMRIVRAWRWTADDSVRLAIHAAEEVLSIYEDRYPGDDRPRQAIEAARAYLADHSADDDSYAAYAAAAYAAYADSYAAYAAASAGNGNGSTGDEARREMRERLSDWMEQHIIEQCEPITSATTATS